MRDSCFEGLGIRKRIWVEGWGARETKGKSVEIVGVEARYQATTFQLGLVTIVEGVGYSSSSLSFSTRVFL